MMLDIDTALTEAGRTEAARHLIGRARDGELVDLAVVSALDLCVLGGPRHPLFDEKVARAWLRLGERQRGKLIESATAIMISRGLLIDEGVRTGARPHSGRYALKPELGLALAARCRPSFIVVTEAEGQDLREPRLFALGDQAEPVRGLVVEMPAGLPPDREAAYPGAAKLGPLGWAYRYALVNPDMAAEVLARWTIAPPQRSGSGPPGAYLVSVFQPDRENPARSRLRVRGDGARAWVGCPEDRTETECDAAGLRAVMAGLITGPRR
jgi:hypothetical protein